MAVASACRVTSPSCVTLLIDSATIMPSRQITAAYGYSPALPDAFERPMQWPIIRLSISSTFIPPPLRWRTAVAVLAVIADGRPPCVRGRARRSPLAVPDVVHSSTIHHQHLGCHPA